MFGGNKEEGEAKEKSTDGPEDDKKASVKAAESRPLKITFKQSGGIPTLSVAERDSAKRR